MTAARFGVLAFSIVPALLQVELSTAMSIVSRLARRNTNEISR